MGGKVKRECARLPFCEPAEARMNLAADPTVEAPARRAGISEHRALRALAARSDRRGLMQLTGHVGALLASGALVAQTAGSLWLAPTLLLHGILLTFLFAPLHEAVHRTAFRARSLNEATAWLCGLALALPPAYFRAFHFAHHRHTQDPARDPELAVPKPDSMWAYLRHVSGLPYWCARLTTLARHARGRVEELFISARLRPEVVREARLYLAIYAVVLIVPLAAGSPAVLLFWLLPALLGQPFLRCYLLAEHTGCPLVADMLQNTRTTRSLALVRRLAWNMPFHAEHHAYPWLPFHALPAAHRLVGHKVAVQASGYVAVNRAILRTLAPDARSAAESSTSCRPGSDAR
jgi:fatty acid desaturase